MPALSPRSSRPPSLLSAHHHPSFLATAPSPSAPGHSDSSGTSRNALPEVFLEPYCPLEPRPSPRMPSVVNPFPSGLSPGQHPGHLSRLPVACVILTPRDLGLEARWFCCLWPRSAVTGWVAPWARTGPFCAAEGPAVTQEAALRGFLRHLMSVIITRTLPPAPPSHSSPSLVSDSLSEHSEGAGSLSWFPDQRSHTAFVLPGLSPSPWSCPGQASGVASAPQLPEQLKLERTSPPPALPQRLGQHCVTHCPAGRAWGPWAGPAWIVFRMSWGAG